MAPERTIIHVDMDAFYASVEQRDRPELRGRPVIVGGHPRRGVVLAASYEVRPFGVKQRHADGGGHPSGAPGHGGPPRFDAYVAASEAAFAILESVTPLIEPLSLDEAFLDVTASRQLFGDGPAIAARIRAAHRARQLGLTASAGIATVKFAAKIASDLAKPDGQREVPTDGTRAFLAPLAGRPALGGRSQDLEPCSFPWACAPSATCRAATPPGSSGRVPGGRQLWELSPGDRPAPGDPGSRRQEHRLGRHLR